MSATMGRAVIYGVQPIKPIEGIPADAIGVRVRMRANDVATVFIRFADGIEHWALGPRGNVQSADAWCLVAKIGESRNVARKGRI